MLYGEGKKALIRLQEEIIRESSDESLFAWGYCLPLAGRRGRLLAKLPAHFASCGDIVGYPIADTKSSHFFMTNNGLQIQLGLFRWDSTCSTVWAHLNCMTSYGIGIHNVDRLKTVGLPLIPASEKEKAFWRPAEGTPVLVPISWVLTPTRAIYIKREESSSFFYRAKSGFRIVTPLSSIRIAVSILLKYIPLIGYQPWKVDTFLRRTTLCREGNRKCYYSLAIIIFHL
jgi:hypothetical protein